MSGVLDGRSLKRKHTGTGTHDTPPETWAAIRGEYIAGTEPLTDIAKRHGVLYSAAHRRRCAERWDDLCPPPAPPPPLPATPSRPACPSCGAGSRAVAVLETAWTFKCSGCGRTWDGPSPVVNHGGRKAPSPCCQRRTTVVDRVLHEPGLQTLWHECAGCGMVWRERVDWRGGDEAGWKGPKIGPWDPAQLGSVIHEANGLATVIQLFPGTQERSPHTPG